MKRVIAEFNLHEFIARKEQVLNLEGRLFVLVLAVETVFLLAFIGSHARVRSERIFALGAASVFFVLLLEAIALNAKMGLVSEFLRQMEVYLSGQGVEGLVWESQALDEIIFVPGNAFTLAAAATIFLLLSQAAVVLHAVAWHLVSTRVRRILVTALGLVLLLVIVTKAVSVDFGREHQNVFAPRSDRPRGPLKLRNCATYEYGKRRQTISMIAPNPAPKAAPRRLLDFLGHPPS